MDSSSLKCFYCGKVGPDVEEVIDPYAQEIENVEVVEPTCPVCYTQRAEDI